MSLQVMQDHTKLLHGIIFLWDKARTPSWPYLCYVDLVFSVGSTERTVPLLESIPERPQHGPQLHPHHRVAGMCLSDAHLHLTMQSDNMLCSNTRVQFLFHNRMPV